MGGYELSHLTSDTLESRKSHGMYILKVPQFSNSRWWRGFARPSPSESLQIESACVADAVSLPNNDITSPNPVSESFLFPKFYHVP